MLKIKTKLGTSKISGTGLFANEDIKKGDVIWEFNKDVDTVINQSQFDKLSEVAKKYWNTFSYFRNEEGGYVLCTDNARYTNHSDNPNSVMRDKNISIAARDINSGDEITEDYSTIYDNGHNHF
jgi:uncharacterized protein